MEFRLWAIFSNFGQNMKGRKIMALFIGGGGKDRGGGN